MFIPGCQLVEIAENCERSVVSTKREFLSFAPVLTAAEIDAAVDVARRNHDANAEVGQPINGGGSTLPAAVLEAFIPFLRIF